MDSDQTGNSPDPSEIELLYNEALTTFAECTGLEAKRDDAIKKGAVIPRRPIPPTSPSRRHHPASFLFYATPARPLVRKPAFCAGK
jgi:hypothetical protein